MAKTPIDWQSRHKALRHALTTQRLKELANKLGVPAQSLRQMEVGWFAKEAAWTFPERSHDLQIVGIMRRYADGSKKVMPGGKRGLYVPKNWAEIPGPVFVPEGASDVAALLSRGLCAVGRPQCKGGVAELAELFAETEKKIVVVGENDEKPDGAWPGRDGAREVARQLADVLDREVSWTLPPAGIKDIRELIIKGHDDDGE